MRTFGLIIFCVLIYFIGIAFGFPVGRYYEQHNASAAVSAQAVQAFIRTDPLRQDSQPMEQWFQANIKGDAEAMYQLSSPDLQKQMGHDEFIVEFKHAPSDTPPTITFMASVKLAGFGSELFYDVAIDNGQGVQHATIAVYVDDDGKFEVFAQ